jgi:hypothetical protein
VVLISKVAEYGEEILPMFVRGDSLYINMNRGSDDLGPGRIDKLDLVSGNLRTVVTIPRYAAWHGVVDYIGGRVVRFGQFADANRILRAGVVVLDLSRDSIAMEYHPNTGDANEFIGVAYDHKNKRFIVGERQYGGVREGSNWPNGGGLWVIPYEGLLDHRTWTRVYEFPDYPEVTSVAVFKDYVYVGLWRAGRFTRIVRASLNNLASWGSVITNTNPNVRPYVDAEDNILAIAYGAADGKYWVEWTTDGSNFRRAQITPSSTDSDMLMNVKVVGKYIIVGVGKQPSWRSDLFIIDTTTGNVTALQFNMVGSINNKPFFYDGRQNLYIGTVNYNSGEFGRIYRLVFDGRRVLSLSVPSSVVSGQTITLTATLTDGVNPVSNAEVEFYVVDSVSGYSPVGTYIGKATTDSGGRASITYTVPSDARGKLMFAAIYKG